MSETLQQALTRVYEADWQHRRDGGKCLLSQARMAVTHLRVWQGLEDSVPVDEVQTHHIQRIVAKWYEFGTAPATITKRLNCLSKLGVSVEGTRPPKKHVLKWWLRPEDRDRLCRWLRAHTVQLDLTPDGSEYGKPAPRYASFADLIEWTTITGLRIEESLRLDWHRDIGVVFETVSVPGTKTANSQATLPLGARAVEILKGRAGRLHHAANSRVFGDLDYLWCAEKWATACRPFLGAESHPTCTLKALRRSAARYLAVERNMPLDVVREYLRHEDIETTMGYLRLTGGYNTEEMRRWL